MTARLTRALTAALMMFSAANAFGATDWEAYVYKSDATLPAVQGVLRMIDTVRQQTDGELEIHLHLGGTLPIKAAEVAVSVRSDVIRIGDDGFADTFPFTGILRLPMLLQNYQDLDKAMAIRPL